MARVRRPLSSVKVTLRIEPDTSGLDSSLAALDRMIANPMLIAQVMKQAVAETLLAAYRKRFLDNFEKALSPELASSNGGPLVASAGAVQAKQEISVAYRELAAAESSGDRAAKQLAAKKLDRAQQKLIAHSVKATGPSGLSTGQFRELAMQVLQTLTDASLVAMQATETEVQLGIGRVAALEAFKTPSATPKLTGHPTGSAFTSLWKQLEFGTGVYSTLPGGQRSPAGWWYGPRPGFGLQLLGARGVHAVFDAATGVPYDADALQFETVFAGLLGRALSGR